MPQPDRLLNTLHQAARAFRTTPGRTGLLLAADLIYELRNIEPLVAFIKQVLLPDGVCLLADQDRIPMHALRQSLEAEQLPYTTQIVRAGEPGGRRLKGTLYRIRRH